MKLFRILLLVNSKIVNKIVQIAVNRRRVLERIKTIRQDYLNLKNRELIVLN